MDCERNRILNLKTYLTSLGIQLNIGKTKARGNKGFFLHKSNNFRIDISECVNDANILSVLLHEFAHYVHYSYDKTLSSLDFIFSNFEDELKEELVSITVHSIPKEFASELYTLKQNLESEIKSLSIEIKKDYPNFKLSNKYNAIESKLPLCFKYLLKYDKVKFFNKVYSIGEIDNSTELNKVHLAYIKLKTKQRHLKRVNSKINRLNKYYNNHSELFARFIELYYTQNDIAFKLAPKASLILKNSDIPLLNNLADCLLQK